MGDLTFVDAIGSAEITGGPYDGVCFYMGGNAYRVWPTPEVHGRPERYRLGIWVRSNPQDVNPADDAAACIAAIMRYGVPQGKLIALDSETAIDPAWTKIFVPIVNGAGIMHGWPVIDYGSQGDVFGNQNPDGYYWGADWTNRPHITPGDVMTQWRSLSNIDISEASATLPFWDTRPQPSPPPKPQQEIDMGYPYHLDYLKMNQAACFPVPPGKVQVVLHADPGFGNNVKPNFRVGAGPEWKVEELQPVWGSPAVFMIPAGCKEVTVGRIDAGTTPVTVDFQ